MKVPLSAFGMPCGGQPRQRIAQGLRTHQDLVEKLCSGDAEAAEGTRRHIVSSKDRAVERLQPFFQMGPGGGRRMREVR